MAKKAPCPQCGARNDLDARRCRVCTNLLNAAAPEVPHRPKGLPDSVQRQIESELGLSGEVPPPSFAAAPPPLTFGDAPPPPTSGDPYGAPTGSAPSDPFPPLHDVRDEEPFDPDALFRDMGRSHLPPPPPPPPDPDELRLPPPQAAGPDPLWSLSSTLGDDPTTEQIEQATREALRQERLKKRPGFLDRVFKADEDDQQQQQQ